MTQNEQIIGVKISTDLFQALGNYLVTKPYNEVANLIAALQHSEGIVEDEQLPITPPSDDKTTDK